MTEHDPAALMSPPPTPSAPSTTNLAVDDSWDGYGIRPFAAGETPKIAEHPVNATS